MGRMRSNSPLVWIIGLSVIVLVGYGLIVDHRPLPKSQPDSATSERVTKSIAAVASSHVKSERTDQSKQSSEPVPPETGGPQLDAPWIDLALNSLSDPDPGVRMRALWELRNHPVEEAIDLVCKYLNDPDDAVLAEAIDTLGFLGLTGGLQDPVYDVLREKALDPGFAKRGQALITAAMVGKNRLLPDISTMISEDTDGINDFVVRALSLIDTPACVPYLESLLNRMSDPEVRRNAFDALTHIGTKDALALLQTHAFSSGGPDQINSVKALARLNAPDINQRLADQIHQDAFKKETLTALAKSNTAPEIFGDVLQRGNVTKSQKLSLLKVLDKHAAAGSSERREKLSRTLSTLLNDPDPDIQVAAIAAISKSGGPNTYDMLKAGAESPYEPVREKTLEALIGYVTPENYRDLFEYMWDENEKIRRPAFMMVQTFAKENDRDELERLQYHSDSLIAEQSKKFLKTFSQNS